MVSVDGSTSLPSMSRATNSWILGFARTLFLVCCAATLRAQGSFESHLQRARQYLDHSAFGLRVSGRDILGLSEDPRAFDLLLKIYREPEEPVEFSRSVTASILGSCFVKPEFGPLWERARRQHRRSADAWLWHQSVLASCTGDPMVWMPVAESVDSPWLRAATVSAAGIRIGHGSRHVQHLDSLTKLLDGTRGKSLEIHLMLESAIASYETAGPDMADRDRAGLEALVSRFHSEPRDPRSMHVVARSISRATGTPNFGPHMLRWLALLAAGDQHEAKVRRASTSAEIPTQFFGLREHAQRICYVIDASDSMLEPLTAQERTQLAPITGRSLAESGVGGYMPSDIDHLLDWSKIVTRFDAARALFRHSVTRLRSDQYFCVLLFGSRAQTLDSTPRLMAASKHNVAMACDEMDMLRERKQGGRKARKVLLGDTNMHAGLVMAFRMTARGVSDKDAALSQEFFDTGADAIFLLSDGFPNTDDFPGEDVIKGPGGTVVGSLEHPGEGRTEAYQGPIRVQGPFASGRRIAEDVARLNLFRRCAIHAVGLGEADDSLLESIARIGGGTTLQVGQR